MPLMRLRYDPPCRRADACYARIAGEAHPGETLRAMIRTGEVAQAVEAAINQNYSQR